MVDSEPKIVCGHVDIYLIIKLNKIQKQREKFKNLLRFTFKQNKQTATYRPSKWNHNINQLDKHCL